MRKFLLLAVAAALTALPIQESLAGKPDLRVPPTNYSNRLPAPPPPLPAQPPRIGVSGVPGPLGIGNPLEGPGGTGVMIHKGNKGVILEGGPHGGGATIVVPLGGKK